GCPYTISKPCTYRGQERIQSSLVLSVNEIAWAPAASVKSKMKELANSESGKTVFLLLQMTEEWETPE
ncbi:hypothetical protein STEG23_011137, partial [Scotinomys teguina]